MDTAVEVEDQPFDAESVGDSEDADLFPYSPERIGWLSWMMICPDRPPRLAKHSVSALYNLKIATCVTLLEWIRAADFPPWKDVKGLCPEIRLLWHHRNNLSADANGVIWREEKCTRVASYSYSYQDRPESLCFRRITLRCLAVIWDETAH